MSTLKSFLYLSLYFSSTITTVCAQQAGSSLNKALADRTQLAPESVFKKFQESGMKPINHILTATEKEKVSKHLMPCRPCMKKF